MTASKRRDRLTDDERRSLALLPPRPAEPALMLALEPSSDLPSGHRIRAAAPVAARYRLRWANQELELPPGTEFSIGRAPECLLRLRDNLVSRHHARLSHGAEGPLIEDLSSLNGVLVNHRRICAPTLLRHGDVIAIGDELIKLVNVEAPQASAERSTLRVGQRSRTGHERVSGPTPSLGLLSELLSERERRVFALMVQGHTELEMAARLNLGVKTIQRHMSQVATRLDCRTRAELVTYAICAGLLREL